MEKNLQTRKIERLIFEFRGYRVMIDSDLASLYETETKKLKQQVKRNSQRFPVDFAFELTADETKQLVTICDRLRNLKHSNVRPLVFTEQGVSMLSSVLRSPKAIKINIEIMRAFVFYRQIIAQNQDIYKKIEQLDNKIDNVFEFLLDKIETTQPETQPLGYRITKSDK
jgi:hypothetical protein